MRTLPNAVPKMNEHRPTFVSRSSTVLRLVAGLGAATVGLLCGTGAVASPRDALSAVQPASIARAAFARGSALFERPLAGPPAGRACASCHGGGGRSDAITVLAPVTPALGREPAIETTVFTYPDESSVLLHRPTDAARDHAAAQEGAFAPRIAPQIWTASAIAAVPQSQILAWADPDDVDGDGVSGRVRWTFSLKTHRLQIGRFGWKATAPTLEDQIANALATDMGLSNPLIRTDTGDCPPAPAASGRDCFRATAFAGDPASTPTAAMDQTVFDLLVGFTRGFAAPRFTGDAEVYDAGIAWFDRIGCAACHRHAADQGDGPAPPFTDLLLHDLGPGLADRRRQGSIAAAEWRTAPLRGLGQTRRVNPDAGYLHDGRAVTVEQAILWHGGEAAAARDRFVHLPAADRAVLLAFLNNL